MAYEVIMPKLGQTVEEGRIVEWLKAEGDAVDRGDVLFTVETDKAVLDVEATRKGFLRKILAQEGETLSVLSVVGIITRTEDEPLDEVPPSEAEAPLPTAKADAGPEAETPVAPEVETAPRVQEGRIFASPRARKYAREHGVDIAAVTGSGPNGRIIERDVMDFLASQPKATPVAQHLAQQLDVDLAAVTGSGPRGRITKADVLASVPAEAAAPTEVETPMPSKAGTLEVVPLEGVRAVIARHMHESHSATAPVTLTMEVDATDFVALRERLKTRLSAELGFNPSYNDLLIKVAARALRAFPYMNARLDGEVIRQLDAVHIGLAVDTDRGLLVPHVANADQKGLVEIARDVRAMAERARDARSHPDELSGGTFTITNLGAYGVDGFTPIINYPETAILGVGRITPRPVVVDGEIVVRQMVWLSLTFDHRLVDGAPAARFMQMIKQTIEEPYLLLA